MKINNKLFLFLSSSLFLFYGMAAQAVCPVCTVAVGAGVGLAEYLGIDDAITGTWVGGLILSMTFWTIDYLNRKNIRFVGRKIIVTVVYYALALFPLYQKNLIGHTLNKMLGFDKLLFGVFWGSVGFVLGNIFNSWLKKRNGGKVLFPFQKVAFSIAPLLILSLVFYIISK